MSDTKALEAFLQHKRPSDFLCECLSIEEHPHCNCGRDQAAAELKEIQDDLQLCGEGWRNIQEELADLRLQLATIRDDLIRASKFIDELRHERIHLRSDLDEALQVIGDIWIGHNSDNVEAFLARMGDKNERT